KLNPIPLISSQTEVPFVGQVMASRWAFEALMVDQYINNDYEQKFYRYEKYKNMANYKKDFWIGKMQSKLEDAQSNYQNPKMRDKAIDDITLLQNEIKKERVEV